MPVVLPWGILFHIPSVILFLALLLSLPQVPGAEDIKTNTSKAWVRQYAVGSGGTKQLFRVMAAPLTAETVLNDLLKLFPHMLPAF